MSDQFEVNRRHLTPDYSRRGPNQNLLLEKLKRLKVKSVEEMRHLEVLYCDGESDEDGYLELEKALATFRANQGLKEAAARKEERQELKLKELESSVEELKKSLHYLTNKVVGTGLDYSYGPRWGVVEPGSTAADKAGNGPPK